MWQVYIVLITTHSFSDLAVLANVTYLLLLKYRYHEIHTFYILQGYMKIRLLSVAFVSINTSYREISSLTQILDGNASNATFLAPIATMYRKLNTL